MKRLATIWLLLGIAGCARQAATDPEAFPGANGAVYGDVDFRQEPKEPLSMVARASATVALFCADAVDDPLSTFADNVAEICGPHGCGPGLAAVVKEIGKTPLAHGVRGAGVLIRPNVVVTPRHVASEFDDAVEGLSVVFGFQGNSPTRVPVGVELLCNAPRTLGDLALLQLRVPDGVKLPPPQDEIADHCAATELSSVLAFGHPFGTARLMTGDDEQTHIHDCRDHGGRAVHTTLDSLDFSSGTAVYIPHDSDDDDDDDGWILFGLLYTGINNTINGREIVTAPAHDDVCKVGRGVGPVIAPLGRIPTEAINAVAAGNGPGKGWRCHHPSDEGRVASVCTNQRASAPPALSREEIMGEALHCK